MAQPAKRKVPPGTSGRVTPKGGHPVAGKAGSVPPASARYTPPIPREMKVSPTWVPVLMGVFLALGVLVIILNYVALLPTWGILPDDTSNMWLLVGLAFILGGIVVATQWH
ncbi:MAG: cell division protein CrgA [Acidimicrobiia bacterium]|nr:cell division protein CrgA [Acidimicrobiia bacterium]